jgi:hypothetical protein
MTTNENMEKAEFKLDEKMEYSAFSFGIKPLFERSDSTR